MTNSQASANRLRHRQNATGEPGDDQHGDELAEVRGDDASVVEVRAARRQLLDDIEVPALHRTGEDDLRQQEADADDETGDQHVPARDDDEPGDEGVQTGEPRSEAIGQTAGAGVAEVDTAGGIDLVGALARPDRCRHPRSHH